jgi:hypothetical protein
MGWFWHHENPVKFGQGRSFVEPFAGQILSTGTSWPSGTLHLTDFVDHIAFFAGIIAGEE